MAERIEISMPQERPVITRQVATVLLALALRWRASDQDGKAA